MIELKGVEKTYRRGSENVHALRGIDLVINPGEFISVVGPSGAGKSSLLHILGCVDRPTAGTVLFNGDAVERLPEHRLTEMRRKKIGFIFQQFYLIPGMTVLENIGLPVMFGRNGNGRERVLELAELVGLGARVRHLPKELSGGEMQRVAIARALVNSPELILADEPTGNLDTENSERIYSLLQELSGRGYTVVMVTHNNELARRAGRIIHLKDGRVRPEPAIC